MSKNNAMPSARLVDIQNVTGLQMYRLVKTVTRIGRVATNDFVILKNTISASHARIEYRDNAFYLSDMGSTNKTRLNGRTLKPTQPVKVSDGDEIVFDVFKFAFVIEQPQAEAAKGKGASVESQGSDEVIQKIGNYEAVARLGKGGFGTVWKARDPRGKTVAIKLLNPENLTDERAVRKFFHEAIILSHLDHPNITQFIDFFPHDKNYVIVMDFVEGCDLKTLLRRKKGPFDLKLACSIAEQVLDAFHFAHQKKVLHRDIKPENIILDSDGNARIMDFGIAKMSTATTQKTAFNMISPLYTPPERFDRNCKVDVRSDIYALGIVLYEIFSGRHPIEEDNPSRVIFAHLNRLFDAPDQYANIPPAMSKAIMKALEKDPKDRFQDFAEFKKGLLGKSGMITVDKAAVPDADYGEKHLTGPLPGEEGFDTNDALMPGRIDVPEEYFKVAVAVLHLFTETLKKYPPKGLHFSVIQQGLKLRLVIDTSDGERRILEKDMEKILAAAKAKRSG